MILPVPRQRTSVWERNPDAVLDFWQATPDERTAVNRAAMAMLEFEHRAEHRRPYGDRQEVTGYTILDGLHVDAPRWCALATAAIYRAEQLRGYPCVLKFERRRDSVQQARYRAQRKGQAA